MRSRILAAVAALTALAAPAAAEAAQDRYRAEVRRTTGGWAHVTANDYGSLGYGYGYGYAQDQLCRMAEIVVTVNARRSRWFGPGDGSLESDFFYQRIKDMRTVQRLARRRPPHGPSRIVRASVRGFVAGYNAYLRRTGRGRLPDRTCRGIGFNRRVAWSHTVSTARRFTPYELRLRGGPRGLPRVTRTDYVSNSNDSYWLPSARLRIDGYPRIIGGEGTQRLLRTRLALLQAEQRLTGTDGLGPTGFTLGMLQQVIFGNRNLGAELARDATVGACRASERADLAEACAVLAAWDARVDTGSRGALLWRDYWSCLSAAGVPWSTAYDPADPIGAERHRPVEPKGPGGPDRRGRGPARQGHSSRRAARRAAGRAARCRADLIGGCSEAEGCFNIVSTERDEQGRYDPFTGASSVMAAAFDARGRVRGEAILSYSQSENPRSEHYADQTRLFSQERWLPMRFTERQIRRDPDYERTVVSGRR